MPDPEPWLRGPVAGVNPLVAPVFFSFAQVREDLARFTAGLTRDQVWQSFPPAPPLGFHLKHIAGSVDRLVTYLSGSQLTGEQLMALKQESQPDGDLPELITGIEASLRSAESVLSKLDPATLYEPRSVGRSHLPSTVIGLIVHLSEHTQRHLGQAITAAQVSRHRRL
ncbi:MAG TPA: DinB family protein [Bryobacteraceae bacterium]|jgi:hypothetical protein|nr:DinB family protein [Bryobacteraceae bacterium]